MLLYTIIIVLNVNSRKSATFVVGLPVNRLMRDKKPDSSAYRFAELDALMM